MKTLKIETRIRTGKAGRAIEKYLYLCTQKPGGIVLKKKGLLKNTILLMLDAVDQMTNCVKNKLQTLV